MRICGIILTILTYKGLCQAAEYNRSQLQKERPGFGEDFILSEGPNGEEVYTYLKTKRQPRILYLPGGNKMDIKDKLFFTYYNQKRPGGVGIRKMHDLPKSFNKSKRTVFITHGWRANNESNACVELRDAYLKATDFNIFVLDWSGISANLLYTMPMSATPAVGNEFAKFLNNLIDKKGVNPKDIHLIGHSLGAHVSGFAGRKVQEGRVGRITGLDPALPGFVLPFGKSLVKGGHLNQKDSHFVDIIHTCAGFLGVKDPIGHVDFYPNGGTPPQPGCLVLKFMESCSHDKSWRLYAESIGRKTPYMASKCRSLDILGLKECRGSEIPLGEHTPQNARGLYFTDTEPAFWEVSF